MEYAVRAETKEGDVVTLQRGFPLRHAVPTVSPYREFVTVLAA